MALLILNEDSATYSFIWGDCRLAPKSLGKKGLPVAMHGFFACWFFVVAMHIYGFIGRTSPLFLTVFYLPISNDINVELYLMFINFNRDMDYGREQKT